MRAAVTFAGIFAGVLVILLAGVGQLGKIDRQTLVVVLVLAIVAAAIGTWRTVRRQ